MSYEYLVVTYKDSKDTVEQEINLSYICEKALKTFFENSRYWRDPAIDWDDLVQEAITEFLEYIYSGECDYDESQSKLSTWVFNKLRGYMSNFLKKGGIVHQSDKSVYSEYVLTTPYYQVNELDSGEFVMEESCSSEDVVEESTNDESLAKLLTTKLLEYCDPITADMLMKYYNLNTDEEWQQDDLADYYGMTQQAVGKRFTRAYKLLRQDHELNAEMELLGRQSTSVRA